MSEGYGLMPGRYPAVVASYSKQSREVRVHINGLTDGGDVGLLAEIEYPIGDKSWSGPHATEIEILAGDPVWVAFEAGDSRKPIITGYRNPTAGNDVDWRRWHHANMELLADQLMNMIAGGVITIKSDVLVKIDAPLTHVLHDLTVDGLITGLGGLAISGGEGASFNGRVAANGDSFTHNGTDVGDTHDHGGVVRGGARTDPANQ